MLKKNAIYTRLLYKDLLKRPSLTSSALLPLEVTVLKMKSLDVRGPKWCRVNAERIKNRQHSESLLENIGKNEEKRLLLKGFLFKDLFDPGTTDAILREAIPCALVQNRLLEPGR